MEEHCRRIYEVTKLQNERAREREKRAPSMSAVDVNIHRIMYQKPNRHHCQVKKDGSTV